MSFRFLCPLCFHDLEVRLNEAHCPSGCSKVARMSNSSWYWISGTIHEPKEVLYPDIDDDTEEWVGRLWNLFIAMEIMSR